MGVLLEILEVMAGDAASRRRWAQVSVNAETVRARRHAGQSNTLNEEGTAAAAAIAAKRCDSPNAPTTTAERDRLAAPYKPGADSWTRGQARPGPQDHRSAQRFETAVKWRRVPGSSTIR